MYCLWVKMMYWVFQGFYSRIKEESEITVIDLLINNTQIDNTHSIS